MQYDLSIVIPARGEEWLSQTVQDVLKNKRGKTEVIVVADGYLPDPAIPDHQDVRLILLPESIGQRAAQNLGVKLSRAKWVMKLDSHCAIDEGYDVKMLEKAEEDMILVGVMRNLHVFDWVCQNCGMRTYQGPEPEYCRNEICDSAKDSGEGHTKLGFRKELVWNPKTNPQSSAYRFNKKLRFKYFPELRAKLPKTGLQETMSLQGSCFMCTRELYWGLNLCDSNWGSWGQQGSEVALKGWLSGNRVLCNMDTWYGHCFRTQPGFSFPYPQSGQSQDRARKISEEIFLNDNWDKAIHPLSWLLEKFWFALKDVRDPEARWEESDLTNYKKPPSREIIYYTAHKKPIKIARKVQNQLKEISKQKDIPILSVSLKPMPKMGINIHLPLEPGILTYFTQIVTALRHSKAEVVYLCEDDVLYHPSHFDFIPTDDKFHFNQNWWKVRPDGLAVRWDANQVSGLIAKRQPLLSWYQQKLEEILKSGFNRSYEPGGRDEELQIAHKSELPYIDLRLGGTLTKDKWSLDDFRDKSTAYSFQESTISQIPGWDNLEDVLKLD